MQQVPVPETNLKFIPTRNSPYIAAAAPNAWRGAFSAPWPPSWVVTKCLQPFLGWEGETTSEFTFQISYSLASVIHFPQPGWQKLPWTSNLVKFGSLWAPSGPPPLSSSTPNPSCWARRDVAALVGAHHHWASPSTPRWKRSSRRAVIVPWKATWVSCSTSISESISSCQRFMCEKNIFVKHIYKSFPLLANAWLTEPTISVVSLVITTGNQL